MRHPRFVVLTSTIAILLSGCGSSAPTSPGADATGPTPTATQTEEPVRPEDQLPLTPKPTTPQPTQLPISPTAGAGALPLGPVPPAVTERSDVVAAVAAEAERSGVPVSQVEVAGYADVTWSDGSVGCPQPGMMYTQALVPGHQLVLRVGEALASYHAAQGKAFSYCAHPVAPTGGGYATS